MREKDYNLLNKAHPITHPIIEQITMHQKQTFTKSRTTNNFTPAITPGQNTLSAKPDRITLKNREVHYSNFSIEDLEDETRVGGRTSETVSDI